jgi:hypothetical protein
MVSNCLINTIPSKYIKTFNFTKIKMVNRCLIMSPGMIEQNSDRDRATKVQTGKKTVTNSEQQLPVIGWREQVALPELGILEVKAKIDTGARSSALHAFDIETFPRDGKMMVRFKVHPYQRDSHRTIIAQAELIDQRYVRNSSGYAQLRPVIQTTLELGHNAFPIELTLTNRDVMGFRMLLGREAIRQRFLVDAGKSFLQSGTGSKKGKQDIKEEV